MCDAGLGAGTGGDSGPVGGDPYSGDPTGGNPVSGGFPMGGGPTSSGPEGSEPGPAPAPASAAPPGTVTSILGGEPVTTSQGFLGQIGPTPGHGGWGGWGSGPAGAAPAGASADAFAGWVGADEAALNGMYGNLGADEDTTSTANPADYALDEMGVVGPSPMGFLGENAVTNAASFSDVTDAALPDMTVNATPFAAVSENAINNSVFGAQPFGEAVTNAFSDMGDKMATTNLSNVAVNIALGLLAAAVPPAAPAVAGIKALSSIAQGDPASAALGVVGAVPGFGQAASALGVANALSGAMQGPTTASISQAMGATPMAGYTDLASFVGLPSVTLSGLQSAAAQAAADQGAPQAGVSAPSGANPGGLSSGGPGGSGAGPGGSGGASGGSGGEFEVAANYPVRSPAAVGSFGYSPDGTYEGALNNKLFNINSRYFVG